jgi:hypothetical protein
MSTVHANLTLFDNEDTREALEDLSSMWLDDFGYAIQPNKKYGRVLSCRLTIDEVSFECMNKDDLSEFLGFDAENVIELYGDEA